MRINAFYSILTVDDEPVNQQVLQNHLSQADYDINQVYSANEALDFLEKNEKPDLILLDIMMPKMSGYEVCRKIRKKYEPSELPIVMLTAKNMEDDLVKGFKSGANDYITKPFSKDELLLRVRAHIDISEKVRAEKELYRKDIVEVEEINKELMLKYEDARLYDNVGAEYLEKLTRIMEIKKPYLDTEITVTKLSEMLAMTSVELSYLINKHYEMNFNSFINKHRVDEAKKRLQDPKYENDNIISIGFDVGFRSKSSFNLFFKRFTTTTPLKYRKTHPSIPYT